MLAILLFIAASFVWGNENSDEHFDFLPHPFVKDERCMYRVDPGPCKGRIQQVGYDPFVIKCFKFNYTGCGGNPNRFKDEQTCRNACFKDKPTNPEDYSEYEDDENIRKEELGVPMHQESREDDKSD